MGTVPSEKGTEFFPSAIEKGTEFFPGGVSRWRRKPSHFGWGGTSIGPRAAGDSAFLVPHRGGDGVFPGCHREGDGALPGGSLSVAREAFSFRMGRGIDRTSGSWGQCFPRALSRRGRSLSWVPSKRGRSSFRAEFFQGVERLLVRKGTDFCWDSSLLLRAHLRKGTVFIRRLHPPRGRLGCLRCSSGGTFPHAPLQRRRLSRVEQAVASVGPAFSPTALSQSLRVPKSFRRASAAEHSSASSSRGDAMCPVGGVLHRQRTRNWTEPMAGPAIRPAGMHRRMLDSALQAQTNRDMLSSQIK